MTGPPKEHHRFIEIPARVRNAPHAIAQTFIVTREAIRRVLFEETLAMQAAAIAFYGLLSFAPTVLVLLSVGGLVLSGSEEVMASIREYLSMAFPGAHEEMVVQLTSFVSQSKVYGLVGIVVLLWGGSRVFSSVDEALNTIWRVEEKRPYWKSRLLAISLIPAILIAFMGSMAATAFYSLVVGVKLPFIEYAVEDLTFLGDILTYVVPLVLSLALFFLLYWFLPARSIPKRSALIGASVSAVLWEIAKLGFDVYLRNFGRMDKIYGAAAGMAILLFWFYYSAIIFLVGAVVGASDMDRRRVRQDADHNGDSEA